MKLGHPKYLILPNPLSWQSWSPPTVHWEVWVLMIAFLCVHVCFCDAFNRGANLSPFGEIRRFHLEIGHSRESCRSVKKNWGGGGGGGGCRRRICESSVSRHLQRFFPLLAMAGMDPPYSVSDWLTLGSKPAPVRAVSIFFMPAKITINTLSVLIVQIRIRYHLNLGSTFISV